MSLNPQSPIPLYQQLVTRLLREIQAGQWAVGEKIPSENLLAERYAIGRPTVRQATDTLVRRGLLERRRGSGTYVCAAPKRADVFSLMGTSAAFAEREVEAKQHLLQAPALRSVPAEQTHNPFAGTQAYFLSRLSCVAEVPVLLEELYLHPEVFAGIESLSLAQDSLARVAKEVFHLDAQEAEQTFQTRALHGERAEALCVGEGSVLLHVGRRIHFANARDALYSDLYCRTDQFQFSQSITAAPQGGPQP